MSAMVRRLRRRISEALVEERGISVAGSSAFSGGKRARERQRAEKKAEKEERRKKRQSEKAQGDAPAGVDPDIAHIVPGPQPAADDELESQDANRSGDGSASSGDGSAGDGNGSERSPDSEKSDP
jgi:hypothetical protein